MATSDRHWHLASGIEVFPDLSDPDARCLGVLRARPHPTGWFLSAHHRPDLSTDELAHFAEFAKVRAYLLLAHGPTPATWQHGPGAELLARSVVDEADFAELLPDAVPADWG